jgi:hypothetical protein
VTVMVSPGVSVTVVQALNVNIIGRRIPVKLQIESQPNESNVSKVKLFFMIALFVAFAIWGPGEW